MPTGFPPLRLPTFAAARKSFLARLSPDDMPTNLWDDKRTIEIEKWKNISRFEATTWYLLYQWERNWYEARVKNQKNEQFVRHMDERAQTIDHKDEFDINTQVKLAQDTSWERVHTYATFRIDRERFIAQQMVAFLESDEVRKSIPKPLHEFLIFINGRKPEGNQGKEKE